MTNRRYRRHQAHLRALYADGWDVLRAWATCTCEPGACPLEAHLGKIGVDPLDLLEALVTGNPQIIGVDA